MWIRGSFFYKWPVDEQRIVSFKIEFTAKRLFHHSVHKEF